MAACCGHETGQQAEHLGHHEHQHTSQVEADQEGAPVDHKTPAGIDFDCGHCHGTCASMPAPMGDMPRAPDPTAEIPYCHKTNKGRVIACTAARGAEFERRCAGQAVRA